MGEFDKMLDWLLGSNNSEGFSNGGGDLQEFNTVSPLQISVSEGCSTEVFCDEPLALQPDPQASLNELGLKSPPSLGDSVLVPNSVDDHVEQLCSGVGSSSNLMVDEMSSGGWELSRRDDGGEVVQKISEAKEKTTEDAKLWRKNGCPRRHRRDAERHSQAEKKRRQKFNQKMRTLQSLIPEVEKVDTASVLGKAIDYVKSLQHYVHQMWVKMNNPTATPLGASTAGRQSPQFLQFGSMEPRNNEEMPFNDDGKPVMLRSLSVPSLPSSQAMAQCYLSRVSSLPRFHGFPSLPLFQMPHAPAGLQYEGFRPPSWFSPVALGIPTALNHQQLPMQTQDMEETSNTKLESNNWDTGSS